MVQIRCMFSLGLILVPLVCLSLQHVDAQTDCGNVIFKLLSCESFLFGSSNVPSPQCCANAQDLVQAANASKDVLKATCQCLKNALQSFPVDLGNAANLTQLCHLNLSIPISPSVDCDSL